MGEGNLYVETIGQMGREMLRAIDRTVLPTSTSEADLHVGELPFHEALDMTIHQ